MMNKLSLVTQRHPGVCRLLGMLGAVGAIAGVVGMSACAADERVGHTKTTTKRVIDTPTEKTTVTETRDKDTRFEPR